MIKTCISRDWLYLQPQKGYVNIDLPHDYAVSAERSEAAPSASCNGFYPDACGTYIKYLTFDEGRHYILDLDGAYMCTQIFMNESHIALHPYGYTPFQAELTPHIAKGVTNKLKITTTPLSRSSRWYSGNGIYRDVFLWEGGSVRIQPWDMFVSTVSADEKNAVIRLSFTITSDKNTEAKLNFLIKSPSGDTVARDSVSVNVRKGKGLEAEKLINVPSPLLWDMGSPHLYTLETEIFVGDTLTDSCHDTFGIRTFYADAKNGLVLNGKSIKLKGGCIHHDHAVLGAASFPAAEERKIRKLMEAGFNAIRTAHNPPSLALLECCDRLGMIVMDEAFDCWNKGKVTNDYHLFFEAWCERDISYMVLRDRNHPCVFSYSIGNEIGEIDGTSDAGKWSRLLCDAVRKLDDTRFVTSGIQKIFAIRRPEAQDPEDYKEYITQKHTHQNVKQINSACAEYEKPLDIVGCNYYYKHYAEEHECYPDRVLWASETQAIHFYDSWKAVEENSYIIGDFTWTAYDNMGETGAGRSIWDRDGAISGLVLNKYPWRSCYQGDLDMCGYRRPQSYFRQAMWDKNAPLRIFVTHPEHFGETLNGTCWHWYDVSECWTFDSIYEGRPVKAEVYTTCDKVEWYINSQKAGESVPVSGIASIETVYHRGEITAVCYRDGKECARHTLYSTDDAAAIDVKAEKEVISADNRDLCYFDITITDKNGRAVVTAQNELYCKVSGGELMGIFGADPANEDRFTSNCCHAFDGRAVAVVRARNAGKINIVVYSDALASGHCSADAV